MKKSILTTTLILAALVAGAALGQTTVLTETTREITELESEPESSGGRFVGKLGGPVGAAVGVAGGTVVGDIGEDASTSAPKSYVLENRTESVVVDRGLSVGAQLPETAQIATIPDSRYSNVHVDGQPVLVEPQSRKNIPIYE